MKQEKLYHKTVDILVQAYFNDTLEVGNYCACAIGNIIAANNGYKYFKDDMDNLSWENVSDNIAKQWFILVKEDFDKQMRNEPFANYQIHSTGYALDEVIEIENAFENAPEGETDDEDMFNGLMAVIDALDKIHKNTSTEISQTAKQKFLKQSTL